MVQIYLFNTGLLLAGVPAYRENILSVMHDYISKNFAPVDSYESFLICGAIGGFLIGKDAVITQRVFLSIVGGYLTSTLLFSFSNYSTTALDSSSQNGNSTLGSLDMPMALKYVILGVPMVVYLVMVLLRRTRFVMLAMVTSIMSGYFSILATEFLGWFPDGKPYFANFDGIIDMFVISNGGSICTFELNGKTTWNDKCFQRHFIWLVISVSGFLIQVLSTLLVIKELPYSCRFAPDLPKAVLKRPFAYKDNSDSMFSISAIPGKEQKHYSKMGDFYSTSFSDVLKRSHTLLDVSPSHAQSINSSTHSLSDLSGHDETSHKYASKESVITIDATVTGDATRASDEIAIQLADSENVKGKENMGREASEGSLDRKPSSLSSGNVSTVSKESSGSSSSSFYESYINLSYIPDPVIGTIAMILMFILTAVVTIAILLCVDWIFSSTLLGILFCASFVIVFRAVIDAFFQTIFHYILYFKSPKTGPKSEEELQPFTLSNAMKTIGAYCLLSNHELSSADCFKTMYGTFCRNMDLEGNYETSVVSVTNNIDIVRLELQLRDTYKIQLCRDMYCSLRSVLADISFEEVNVHFKSTSSFDSTASSIEIDLLPSWVDICESNVELMKTHFLDSEEGLSEDLINWINSLDGSIPYDRLARIWKQFIHKQKEKNPQSWKDSFASKAREFIDMQCIRFMYFHRNSRVLRKPGQYQDMIQLATWGIDYSYAYDAEVFPKGNPHGARTFGFEGNLKNNGRYSDEEFEALRRLLEKNTKADFERVRDAGLSHADHKANTLSEQSKSVSSSDSLSTQISGNCPYAFTLLMDADTNAPESCIQTLVQIGFSNPLNGIVQPLIDAGNSYTTEEIRYERKQTEKLRNSLLFNSLPEDSPVMHEIAEESEAEGVVPQMPSEYMDAPVTVFPHTYFMWRTKLKQICVPTVGASLSKIFGRSYFYGKGLINNLAYCSLLIGTPEKPRNILPLDIYSHDTYESLFCRPCVTDKVVFMEEAMANPLALHSQQCRWMIGELINGCYLYPQTVGLVVRGLRAVIEGWYTLKKKLFGATVARFPFILKSGKDEDQDICNMGTFIAAYFAKEPIRILTAPFFICFTLALQTLCTSTVRPVPSIADIYNEQQLFSEVISTKQDPKYWFFIYFKNFDFFNGLLVFMFLVWVGVPVVFKAFDICFRLNYRLHANEPRSVIWRRKGIHFFLCIFETLFSVISYPPEILMGGYRVVKAFWALATGKLNWRPQREVELEMDAIAAAGWWPLLKTCFKSGGGMVSFMGFFLIAWLVYIQPTFVNDSTVLIIPAFVVWMGAVSWMISPFWSLMLATEMSLNNFLFEWLVELELVLNRVGVLEEPVEAENECSSKSPSTRSEDAPDFAPENTSEDERCTKSTDEAKTVPTTSHPDSCVVNL